MNINILTTSIKRCNLILNISILIFAIIGFSLLVGYLFFFDTNFLQLIFYKLMLIGLSLLVFGIVVSVFRDNLNKKLSIELTDDDKLEINSRIKPELIEHWNEIKYARNYIVTEKQRIEIDNETAFRMINQNLIKHIETIEMKNRTLEMNPEKIVERVRSIIFGGITNPWPL